jgi:uncharacterized protein
MTNKEIVEKTKEFVKNKLEGEGSGHDWWHILRVYNNAVDIAGKEGGCDIFTIELAALLHDIADWKFHDGDLNKGAEISETFLSEFNISDEVIKHVSDIIKNISFKGAKVKNTITTKEGMIVQDADRLDAIGAIGIGRAFAYGGFMKREMYNPDIPYEIHNTFEEYKNKNGSTINHFYEKLLLLKDRMNTKTGREKAEKRHEFMLSYLEEFYSEWDGNL